MSSEPREGDRSGTRGKGKGTVIVWAEDKKQGTKQAPESNIIKGLESVVIVHILLVGLAQGLVGLLGLLLEQLQAAGEGLVGGRVLGAVVGGLLEVLDHGLELLDLGFEQAVLV